MSYDCACDYEPAEFYSAHKVKAARHPHRCEECGRKIPVGEDYEVASYRYDGRFDTVKTCRDCLALREWAKISVPCFCWAHGNLHDDVRHMVEQVAPDVPGFIMEWGRRVVRIRRAMAREGRP